MITTAGLADLLGIGDEHKLLDISSLPPNVSPIDGLDGFPAMSLGDNVITIPIEKLSISDKTIQPPYIINAIFRLNEVSQSCIFSILDEKNNTVINLCVLSVGPSFTRAAISGNAIESVIKSRKIEIDKNIELENKWSQILVFVNYDSVKILMYTLETDDGVKCMDRLRCEENKEIERVQLPEMYFDKDYKLVLGNPFTATEKSLSVSSQYNYLQV
ncbi:uncharacterized protein LOC119191365 [Manduca sexta]|uniref:uncharacterized protein LOC119191365 n=1 Tax=Manduca sexta TaxID=7130 RepID=UPI00188EE6B9|nr:uncharacterized protein LOC119191365 [Manduca sexta]